MSESPDRPIPDSRPRPQYGEYATHDELAAARGMTPGELRAASEPVAPRSELPKAASSRRHAGPAAPTSVAPPTSSTSGASGRPGAQSQINPRGNLVTVLLLVFGIWNTVTSIPSFLDLGRSLNEGLERAGYGSVSFGTTAHVVGIAILVFSFLVLFAAVGLSLHRMRKGLGSVRVPLIAAGVFMLGLVVAMVVVVANTPGITAIMQNHS